MPGSRSWSPSCPWTSRYSTRWSGERSHAAPAVSGGGPCPNVGLPGRGSVAVQRCGSGLRRPDERRLVTRLRALAQRQPRYGLPPHVGALLRAEGWRINRKQVYRLWRRQWPKVLNRRRPPSLHTQ
jgi:hypothetical protein